MSEHRPAAQETPLANMEQRLARREHDATLAAKG